MISKYILRISLLLFGTSQVILAQDSIAAKNKLIDDRLKTVEKTIGILPKISGLVNLRYQYATEAASYSSGKNGFDVRRARLDFRGNALKELSYRVQVDFAITPKLLDAYVEWKPFDFIGLQAGQFKTPYTLENPYSPVTLETIEWSQAINSLVRDIDGNKNNGRDIGLSLNGNLFSKKGFSIIEYKLGVYNGNIINTTDNNTSKDVVGSIIIKPLKVLSIGLSHYEGEFGPQISKYKHNRSAVGLKYDDGNFLFRTEYISGTTNVKEAEGYYATVGYFITKKLQPVLKYDFYKSDLSNTNSAITNYIVGVNYSLAQKTRIQFNYTFKDNKENSKKDSNYFVTQLLLAF